MNATYEEAQAFSRWLLDEVIADARGERLSESDMAPDGRFWLGRLASEEAVMQGALGERGERLDPCATGITVRLGDNPPTSVQCSAFMFGWVRQDPHSPWAKMGPVRVTLDADVPELGSPVAVGRTESESALAAAGLNGMSCEIRLEREMGPSGDQLTVTLVNTTPAELDTADPNLYETELEIEVQGTAPFVLDDLPDSFRYSREVDAYGVNCGVRRLASGVFATSDCTAVEQRRKEYWNPTAGDDVPDLSFDTLADNPLPSLEALLTALDGWCSVAWSKAALDRRQGAEGWSLEMREEADKSAAQAADEVLRIKQGLQALGSSDSLLYAFRLMNRSFADSPSVSHTGWRAFQMGFLLQSLPALFAEAVEPRPVHVLHFPTGGGKTETYLGVLVTAAFYDRMSGKSSGTTGWARFPLRMLSLQQTQRFADVIASAEMVRQSEGIGGDGFSVGFFVGQGGSPNRVAGDEEEVRPGLPRADDDFSHNRVLLNCPFCGSDDLEMRFDRASWTLNHHCLSDNCGWRGAIPFRIVDEEIYRFLPTVIVGTLDKAASMSMQAAMRGLYAAPLGACPDGHGFIYAPRSRTRTGCLFPGCRAQAIPLQQDPAHFAPRIRIQDELHLLKGSLGAIDSHYEALLDHLQMTLGAEGDVLASSATLANVDGQVEALYQRSASVFPVAGPHASAGFWSCESSQTSRTFAGLAPRGVTLDQATDRSNESLQRAVRSALSEPERLAETAGVRPEVVDDLAALYGVGVVYGCTLRDVEAAARSFEAQVDVSPLNSVTLTGRTPFEEVREALGRLKAPETEFNDRIHLIAASSMLSHGVDLDRLNVMVMLGMPLSTAELIQTTSRVGRTWPGLVLVLHKIGRERDAKVFRSFRQFVDHADRLVDPVPITRKSRRVLEVTFPGLWLGRLYGVHEPQALIAGLRQLTTRQAIADAVSRLPIDQEEEFAALVEMLGLSDALCEQLRQDLDMYLGEMFATITDPTSTARFANDLFRSAPMLSLRDVEQQSFVRGDVR